MVLLQLIVLHDHWLYIAGAEKLKNAQQLTSIIIYTS